MIPENQNKLIEEIRERVGKNRKRVFNYNLLLILCCCFVIIGFLGTIYFYSNLNEAKIKISEQNDSLKVLTKELKYSKDSLQEAKASIAKEKATNDSLLVKLYEGGNDSKGIRGLRKIINNIRTSRDSARNYAHLGYEKLKQYDFPGAEEAFDKSEKSYSGFRDSYEVYFLLRNNRNIYNDPAVQKQLLQKIIEDYNSLGILSKKDIR
jgi:hypothetical protein